MCVSLSLSRFSVSKDLSFGHVFVVFACLFSWLCLGLLSLWFLGGFFEGLQILFTFLSVIYHCTYSGKIIISVFAYPFIEEQELGRRAHVSCVFQCTQVPCDAGQGSLKLQSPTQQGGCFEPSIAGWGAVRQFWGPAVSRHTQVSKKTQQNLPALGLISTPGISHEGRMDVCPQTLLAS